MSDDIGNRADDLQRRVEEAGSTHGLISGILVGIERNRRLVRFLTISLILDVVFSIIFAILSVVAWTNSNNIRIEAKQACVQSAKNSVVINNFLDLLIETTNTSRLFTQKEKETRIHGYNNLIIRVPNCK